MLLNNKKAIIVWVFILLSIQLKAQLSPDTLKQFISNTSLSSIGLQYPKQVVKFYRDNGYRIVWLTGQSRNLQLLSNYIHQSPSLALSKDDYQPALLKAYSTGLFSPGNNIDSLLAEIKFTDAAIHFFHDLIMGNLAEPISYNGLNYAPSCIDIPSLLNAYLNTGRFSNLPGEVEPKDEGYLSVKNKLSFFQTTIAAENFKEVAVKSSKVNTANQPLLNRLYQLGFIDSDTAMLTDSLLKIKVKEVQYSFNLKNDGVVGSATLQALNVPLASRITELEYTLNTIRWLSCAKQAGSIIVVNIPSATLLLFEQEKIVLESRIIVGKPSTPTPTLSSKITEVILFPYWNVPYKIATRELLPHIKRDPGFLDANNYQVLNKQAKVMDPYSINWHELSRYYFPYVLRQSTGCDNSLGLIKLNFYNPFSVYLHDTPVKFLFDQDQRYFSHGCMRVQKAMEVGRYILKGNTIAIDTLEQKGCLYNQAPITVPATKITPVFILYHTSWIDSEANVRFYKDVYDKFPQLRKRIP